MQNSHLNCKGDWAVVLQLPRIDFQITPTIFFMHSSRRNNLQLLIRKTASFCGESACKPAVSTARLKPNSKQYKALGNAIPPVLAWQVMSSMLAAIKRGDMVNGGKVEL